MSDKTKGAEAANEQKKKGISRREFLRNTGLAVGGVALGGALLSGCSPSESSAGGAEEKWDYEADVVVIGAGGAGLPAALKARADGASVMIVDCNWDIGGHAATSGGNLHSGAGTNIQAKYGITDTPDMYYLDHTTNLTTEARFNNRSVTREIANSMAEAFEFILDSGVIIYDRDPTKGTSYLEGGESPESVPRDTLVDVEAEKWVSYNSGVDATQGDAKRGMGLVRPLERTAREQGVEFLMNYHMDKIVREGHLSGRVLGIECSYTPTILPGESEPLQGLNADQDIQTTQEMVRIKANKGVVICTGGHTSNVKFRMLFDPRLTEEYDGVAGDPFSFQDASGELAAMAIGATLGTMANQTQASGAHITQPSAFGTQYGYRNLRFYPESPIWPLVRARGIMCTTYDGVVLVNMLGERFWREDQSQTADYFAAAMASVVIDGDSPTDARRLGGPIWAIFDQATVDRREWTVEPPFVDIEDGRFFKGETLEELAQNVINKYFTDINMDPAKLAESIEQFNAAVDGAEDVFGREGALDDKIATGPFYAAWATPCLHDTLTGLNVTPDHQVLDIYSEPIPGLFCAGESAAGMKIHGFGRVITAGYVAGRSAAKG